MLFEFVGKNFWVDFHKIMKLNDVQDSLLFPEDPPPPPYSLPKLYMTLQGLAWCVPRTTQYLFI